MIVIEVLLRLGYGKLILFLWFDKDIKIGILGNVIDREYFDYFKVFEKFL